MAISVFFLSTVWFLDWLLFSHVEQSVAYWRDQLINYTGIVGFGLMTATMIMSLRPQWLEKHLRGLDKMYRHHKRFGIASGLFIFLHWLFSQGGKWLVELGYLSGPQHTAGEPVTWKDRFEQLGEWSLYLMVALIAISLIQRFTYTKFKLSHKFMGVVFIMASLHVVGLLTHTQPGIIFMVSALLCCAAGCYAAVISLTGRIGQTRQLTAILGEISLQTADLVIFSVHLEQPFAYRAGQFVYISFSEDEGAHPFTVVSYDGDCRIELAIKALGDYTRTLPQWLKKGLPVTIEGPYGAFRYSQRESQVWIGAGIGITPFIAWLDELVRTGTELNKNVTLYYCVPGPASAPFLARLVQLTEGRKDITLRVFYSENGEILDGNEISGRHNIPDTEVYFCGPQGFARALNRQLAALHMPSGQFHSEYFTFR